MLESWQVGTCLPPGPRDTSGEISPRVWPARAPAEAFWAYTPQETGFSKRLGACAHRRPAWSHQAPGCVFCHLWLCGLPPLGFDLLLVRGW